MSGWRKPINFLASQKLSLEPEALVKDWNEKNLRRIAEYFERTDVDAIREDYDAGVFDEFLWPADEDEAEFLVRFQQALGDSQRLSGVPVEGPPEPTFHTVTNLFPPMASRIGVNSQTDMPSGSMAN